MIPDISGGEHITHCRMTKAMDIFTPVHPMAALAVGAESATVKK